MDQWTSPERDRPFRPLTLGGSIYESRACPAGLQNSAQGFNPENPHKGFALKGREMRVLDEARTYWRAKVRVRNWDVRQMDHRAPFPPS
jgi:hypothetical protein